jgi:hypothetical protein
MPRRANSNLSPMKSSGRLAYAGLFLLASFFWPACSPGSQAQTAVAPDTDRWLEIDLYWFKQQEITASARQFWDRFEPLYRGVSGYRGVILNIGWTVGPVMEWSGNLDQRISLPTGSGQSKWVDEKGPLTGTTEERKKKSEARFAGALVAKRRGYDPWTYGDVKSLCAELKTEADRRGISGLRVGILNYAWRDAYGEEAAWVHRHDEAFTQIEQIEPGNFSVGRYFDPAARLHADAAPLGGLPRGIREGMPVHEAYAAQWGSMSRTLGLDAIMLRDSFGMPVPYQRGGPWGPLAPTPERIHQATDAVAALVRETKQANPKALVMMYSNGASAISDWRSNGMDLETIARQGYLDIWVDQTWAGAWNEVGIREGSFWNAPTKGWTYQLAYMLMHAAILADTKVRHYPLVETFDAWESWDVIHSAPERLRWGIWAYSHAGVKTPRGLKMPVGTYISWANQGERLLDDKDVRFLADNINAAVADAKQTTTIFGPTLVYSRESMQWQVDHASPNHDINEWIDEQIGSVIKWPVPILSATRIEWLPEVQSDLFIVEVPTHLSDEHLRSVQNLINAGQPVVLEGSFADGVDPALLRLAGVRAETTPAREQSRLCWGAAPRSNRVENMTYSFQTYCVPSSVSTSSDTLVLYNEEGSPALVLNITDGRRLALWNPPNLLSIEEKPLSEIWGNRGSPYVLAASVFNELLQSNSALHATRIDLTQTLAIAAWRTQEGKVRILAGNLEEGLRDDADFTRSAALLVPDSWRKAGGVWRDAWTGRTINAENGALHITLPQASSVLLEPTR